MPLFSTAEARAAANAQLASVADYPDLTITAKEAEIRAWFERAAGVNFIPTTHNGEVHDGDDSNYLVLEWPRITAVSAITVDGVALSATEINLTDYDEGLAVDPVLPIITRRSGTFLSGWANVVVSYTAGYAACPDLVKRAALQVCVEELVTTTVPWQATGYDDGGTSYSFGAGDGFGERWHKLPDVVKALRLYSHRLPGVA